MSGSNSPNYGKPNPLFRSGDLWRGKHPSDQHKQRISDALKGVPKSDTTKENMKKAAQKKVARGEYTKLGKYAMHVRWHVNRKITNDKCEFCTR